MVGYIKTFLLGNEIHTKLLLLESLKQFQPHPLSLSHPRHCIAIRMNFLHQSSRMRNFTSSLSLSLYFCITVISSAERYTIDSDTDHYFKMMHDEEDWKEEHVLLLKQSLFRSSQQLRCFSQITRISGHSTILLLPVYMTGLPRRLE